MHFLDQFQPDPESGEPYNLNFGTSIELPSGRKFCTGSFDSLNIIVDKSKKNPLPVTVKAKNHHMVHVTHHRNMEEAELAIVALAYFCDSVQYYESLERQVAEEEAQEAEEEEWDFPID